MDAIIEFIFLMIFQIPGAFIRWLLGGCKQSFKKTIEKGDAYLDGFIGLIIFILIIVLIRSVIF